LEEEAGERKTKRKHERGKGKIRKEEIKMQDNGKATQIKVDYTEFVIGETPVNKLGNKSRLYCR
jgi:hypothetical protein